MSLIGRIIEWFKCLMPQPWNARMRAEVAAAKNEVMFHVATRLVDLERRLDALEAEVASLERRPA